MTLREWLTRKEMGVPEFARRIDRTAEAVRRYLNGERIPDRETMRRIVEVTSGDVTPNDFFEIVAKSRRGLVNTTPAISKSLSVFVGSAVQRTT